MTRWKEGGIGRQKKAIFGCFHNDDDDKYDDDDDNDDDDANLQMG